MRLLICSACLLQGELRAVVVVGLLRSAGWPAVSSSSDARLLLGMPVRTPEGLPQLVQTRWYRGCALLLTLLPPHLLPRDPGRGGG